jgi:hypothetical protein
MRTIHWGIVAIVFILGCSTTVPGIDSASDAGGEVETTSDVDTRVHVEVVDSIEEMADVSGFELDGQDILGDANSPDLPLPDGDSSSTMCDVVVVACVVENEFGSCSGEQVCTADGLSDCDAQIPAPETCNGIDDNCNGEIDEPSNVDGTLLGLCDDGMDCTADTCLGAEGCTNETLDVGDCDDGDPCTLDDSCTGGSCQGVPVNCNDDNPCTEDSCNNSGECDNLPIFAPCNDEAPCTVGDLCLDGMCAGTEVPCDCQANADCGALEDGDLCNGVLLCNLAELPYTCEVNPDSIILCPEPEGTDAFCQQSVCDPATGECGFVPDHEGLACDDGNKCIFDASCQEGTCTGGATLNCNDGNPCTDDSCDPAAGCVHTDNTLPCTDHDVCTNGDACTDGQCEPGTPLVCDDGDVCTDDSCNPQLGCQHEANAAPCDDGNACSIGDKCANGSCFGGLPLECDDDNICTDDQCEPETGCVHPANTSVCNDSDLCTVGEYCSAGGCGNGIPVECDDGNPCTDDTCLPLAGCIHTPNSAPCNDGDVCTENDGCDAGTCVAGDAINCDDSNVCTADSCASGLGCVHVPTEVSCDDGNACTEEDSCNNGWCAGTLVDCDDEDQCTSDSCDPQAGCQHSEFECDDGNICTDDSCNPLYGCVFLPNTVQCDDDNACTDNDVCLLWECAGEEISCDDGEVCTTNACDPEVGCVFPDIVPCCGNAVVDEGSEEGCDDSSEILWDGCQECGIVEFQVNSIWEESEQVGTDAVSTFPDGSYVVAWHSQKSVSSDECEQYFTRFSADGTVVCDAIQANEDEFFRQEGAAVEALEDGSVILVWRSNHADPPWASMYMRRFDSNCQPLTETTRIDTYEYADESNAVAETLTNGKVIVVWQSEYREYLYDPGHYNYNHAVVARLLNPDGSFASDEFIMNSTLEGNQIHPDVAALPEGGFVAVWQDFYDDFDIYFQRFDAAMEKTGPEVLVNDDQVLHQTDPTIASLPDGSYVVVWTNLKTKVGTYEHGLMGRLFDADGQPVGDEFWMPPSEPGPSGVTGVYENPRLAATGEVGYILTWAYKRKYYEPGESKDIFGVRLDATGTPVGEVSPYNSADGTSRGMPSIAPFEDGGWMTVWWEGQGQDGSKSGVFALGHDANGEKRYR